MKDEELQELIGAQNSVISPLMAEMAAVVMIFSPLMRLFG
jgi:hypothetical protein